MKREFMVHSVAIRRSIKPAIVYDNGLIDNSQSDGCRLQAVKKR